MWFNHNFCLIRIICAAKLLTLSAAATCEGQLTVEESLKDRSLVNLAYSKNYYDNVGMLCMTDLPDKQGWFFKNNRRKFGSAVYIGGKTCLTAAHCFLGDHYSYDIGFEISGKSVDYYRVEQFVIHHDYEKNKLYDIAVIILDRKVEGLEGLVPCYIAFSRNYQYEDYVHLLTYVGYGSEISENNWFEMQPDGKRRAEQAYLNFVYCSTPDQFGVYSTPYGYDNKRNKRSQVVPYQARPRSSMSGGAIMFINKEHRGLIGLIRGDKSIYKKPFYIAMYWGVAYCFSFIAGIIETCCPISLPALSTSITSHATCISGVPLSAVKDFIEDRRREFDDTYRDDMV